MYGCANLGDFKVPYYYYVYRILLHDCVCSNESQEDKNHLLDGNLLLELMSEGEERATLLLLRPLNVLSSASYTSAILVAMPSNTFTAMQ